MRLAKICTECGGFALLGDEIDHQESCEGSPAICLMFDLDDPPDWF